MKSITGKHLLVTLFGESHGAAIGVVLDGLAPGIPLDVEHIRHQLSLRRPSGKISTARKEQDAFEIVSGFFQGYTTGTPLCILIPNQDVRSRDYDALRFIPRPGHADMAAYAKYDGFQDYRGGGHFSGRLTAALVAAGAIALQVLQRHGIDIGTHIARCAGIVDRPMDAMDPAKDIAALACTAFPVLDALQGAAMQVAMEKAQNAGDSVGGILETCAVGIPAGVGEPWFHSVESELSSILFSIPAVKGVEFGSGFGFADMRGSEANDPFRYRDGHVVTSTNHNGGINGGITNGMPLHFRVCIKPTPSIAMEQETVDLSSGDDTTVSVAGRHDPAILHRARVVIDSVTALVLVDLMMERAAGQWMLGDGHGA